MNTRIRIIPWVMLVVGFILLSAGVAELYPLCRAARNCHHTVGIVQRVETKKNYRHRKLRYDTEMTVIYSTEKYGDLSVTRTSHWPFTRKGDEISVWYHPERPREVHLPVSGCCGSSALCPASRRCSSAAASALTTSSPTRTTGSSGSW